MNGSRMTTDATLTWTCDECSKPVTGTDGYIHMRYTELRAYHEAKSAWKKAHPKVAGFSIHSLADYTSHPRRVSWQVHHAKCDPEPQGEDYWIAVNRAGTPTDLISWTGHLMEKNWIKDTNWNDFIRKAVNHYEA